MGGSSKAPPPPDYAALATQQAGLNKEAFEQQTKANRVNQVGPSGSQTWNQDAAGNWTQTQAYNPEYQKLADAQRSNQQQLTDTSSGMLGGIQKNMSQPFDTSGMTDVQGWKGTAAPDRSGYQNWGQVDLSDNPALAGSGFGSVQEIQQAMLGRMNPAMQQGRDAEIARLKAQGITEGSPAWNASMQSLGQQSNDMNNQALLGAMGAYGDIFNRSLQSRQQMTNEDFRAAEYANSLRGQQGAEGVQDYNIGNQQETLQRSADIEDRQRQMQEALMQRELPLNEYKQLMGAAGGAPNMSFDNYFNQGNAGAPNMSGAAEQQYQAQMDAFNAKQKQKQGMMAGIGTAAGSFFGPIGSAVGGAAGTAVGNWLA